MCEALETYETGKELGKVKPQHCMISSEPLSASGKSYTVAEKSSCEGSGSSVSRTIERAVSRDCYRNGLMCLLRRYASPPLLLRCELLEHSFSLPPKHIPTRDREKVSIVLICTQNDFPSTTNLATNCLVNSS